uniref:Uncharacterized protein n=1 Tax=Cannabis sativa TaxID=3483 RepID=A0A803P530_CANSA
MPNWRVFLCLYKVIQPDVYMWPCVADRTQEVPRRIDLKRLLDYSLEITPKGTSGSRPIISHRWEKPPDGCIKVNCDAGFDISKAKASLEYKPLNQGSNRKPRNYRPPQDYVHSFGSVGVERQSFDFAFGSVGVERQSFDFAFGYVDAEMRSFEYGVGIRRCMGSSDGGGASTLYGIGIGQLFDNNFERAILLCYLVLSQLRLVLMATIEKFIKDIHPSETKWRVKVIVLEKGMPKTARNATKRNQNLLLSDSQEDISMLTLVEYNFTPFVSFSDHMDQSTSVDLMAVAIIVNPKKQIYTSNCLQDLQELIVVNEE